MKLKDKYQKEVIPAMRERFGYKNPMAVPRIRKVVVNTGFGKLVTEKSIDEQKKAADAILEDLSMICGQRAVLTKARGSISGFKVRKGSSIGAKVTLRGKRMDEFLERLIHVILPRSRDFQGLRSDSLDSQGNLTIGIEEHIFFPEISPEKTRHIFGLEITIGTNAKTKEEGLRLLRLLGFPMRENPKEKIKNEKR